MIFESDLRCVVVRFLQMTQMLLIQRFSQFLQMRRLTFRVLILFSQMSQNFFRSSSVISQPKESSFIVRIFSNASFPRFCPFTRPNLTRCGIFSAIGAICFIIFSLPIFLFFFSIERTFEMFWFFEKKFWEKILRLSSGGKEESFGYFFSQKKIQK